MGKNWAIAIGINEYDNLKPLKYAIRDAEAVRDFFGNEIKFDQIYHFAEGAPPIPSTTGAPLKSQPTFGALSYFLRKRFEPKDFLNPEDNFWFFFAGHGKRYKGVDYLLPSDADPGNVEKTALSIREIGDRLRRSGAGNVILLLDACRDEDDRGGQGIGTELQQGVVSIFACSPEELSYEIDELQQGSFTRALLQGLQLQGEGNCATVERLDQHLRNLVPELNRRYGKPRQTPYTTVEPVAKNYMILLTRQATVRDAERLKVEAWKAETEQKDLELAEQFWVRVLAVSPADSDAIKAIQRLARMQPEPEPSRTRPEPIRPPRADSGRSASRSSRGISSSPVIASGISRRRLLQVVGVSVTGGGVLWAVQATRQSMTSHSTSPSQPSPTIQPSPSRSPSQTSPRQTLLDLKPFQFEVVTVNAKGEPAKPKQGEAKYFSEDLGNGIDLQIVAIPGGPFMMGYPTTEPQREDDESPQHSVTLKPFLMGRDEVTQAQWKAVVTSSQKIDRDLKPDPSKFKGAKRPVEQVSWRDAIEFCKRLSKKTGREYRLPSEAEWEYACRAGTTTPFHFGETITTDLANYRGTDWEYQGKTYLGFYGQGPRGSYRGQTTDVGSFPANAFGLRDMHGNVWEWCLDHWHDSYKDAPTDGSAWLSENDNQYRLLRGGSWDDLPRSCRSADRYWVDPDFRDDVIGFRVVCGSAWTLP